MLKIIGALVLLYWVARALYRKLLGPSAPIDEEAAKARALAWERARDTEEPAFDAEEAEQELSADPQRALETLDGVLRHHRCPLSALQFVRTHYFSSFDPTLNRALVAALTDVGMHYRSVRLATLFDVGVTLESLKDLRQFMLEKDTWLEFPDPVKWTIDELSYDDAVDQLVAVGVIEPPDEAMINEIRDLYDTQVIKTDRQGKAYLEPIPLLRALIDNSPLVLVAERYKPGKQISYLEFFEFVFDQTTDVVELNDFGEVYDSEAQCVNRLKLTANGVDFETTYSGDESLDIFWAVDTANHILEQNGLSIRCMDPYLSPDSHMLIVGEPTEILPLLERYHLAYRVTHEIAESSPQPAGSAQEHELRMLNAYAERYHGQVLG